jgi:uroporphyrinogen decarboxylase
MDHRERVLTALEHREPDRVPFDLGGTEVTGMHIHAYRALRQHLGLHPVEIGIVDRIQNQAAIDNDLRDWFGVDVAFVATRPPGGGLSTREDNEYRYLRDQFGILRRMPRVGGHYYDIFQSPLAQEAITVDDVDRLALPDGQDPAFIDGMRAECERIRNVEHRLLAIGSFGPGPFALAGWLRGLEAFFLDMAAEPDLAGRLMDRVLEMKLAYLERAFAAFGDLVDVVCVLDDLGGQQTLLISPNMYRRLVLPRHRELFSFIHSRSSARVFLHTDGAVRDVIPDFIEIGVDILNPVQVSAAGMDSAGLKRDFGADLTFWGGGVDTQHVLPRGTPAQVRDEVRRRLDDFMPGGGYVFNPVHNIQADVPPKNVVAMWEAVREWGGY